MALRKVRVLVIDDEDDICFFIKANLEMIGNYEVSTAADGKEGLRQARRHTPDLIILDVMMPRMDGMDVLRVLKEDDATSSIPVIMLTARADEETKMRAAGSYADGYLTKPVELRSLKASIDSTLASKGIT